MIEERCHIVISFNSFIPSHALPRGLDEGNPWLSLLSKAAQTRFRIQKSWKKQCWKLGFCKSEKNSFRKYCAKNVHIMCDFGFSSASGAGSFCTELFAAFAMQLVLIPCPTCFDPVRIGLSDIIAFSLFCLLSCLAPTFFSPPPRPAAFFRRAAYP